jgi:hypothetical protein
MKMRKTLIALVIALGMVCFVGSASAGKTICLDSYWDSVHCDLDNSALSELPDTGCINEELQTRHHI